jgi:hypothetical protein
LQRGGRLQIGERPRRFLESFECVEVPIEWLALVRGHQENMRVGNTAATGVQGDKFGFEGLHDLLRCLPRQNEQTRGLLGGQVMPPRHMPSGNYQTMPASERLNVEKRYRLFVLANYVTRGFPSNDAP